MKKPLDVIAGLAFCPDYSANHTGWARSLTGVFNRVASLPALESLITSNVSARMGLEYARRNRRVPVPYSLICPSISQRICATLTRFFASVYWFGRYKNGAKVPGHAVLIIAALSLSACSSPAVRVQYIETKTYIPIPATLTQPISVDLTNATWGAGIGSLNAALQTCNARLDAIHTLVPPPVKPPINP